MILHDYPIKKGGWKNVITYLVKRIGYFIVFWWSAKLSQAIVVPSQDAKKDLIARLKIPPSKITVTPEGFDFSLKAEEEPAKGGDSVLNRYKISVPYLLAVGSMYPHKNLQRLVDAFALIKGEIYLVLLGKESFFSQKLRQKISEMGLSHKIFFPGQKAPNGYVPDKDLPEFYRHASLFVFPSLKEGFGIPPLEAMAHDLPVVASKASCIPEVCGDAALYFDPKDPQDMAQKISYLLENEKLRNSLIKKGRNQVKKFSWKKMAAQTLEVFKKSL